MTVSLRASVFATLMLVALGGCASQPGPLDPTATGSDSATPTATAVDEKIASIELSADELISRNSGGDTLAVVALSGEPSAALEVLTDALGPALEYHYDEPGCWGELGKTQWSWGDQAAVSVYSWQTPAPHATWRAANDFYVDIRVADLTGVSFSGSTGATVGQSLGDQFDQLPPAQVTTGYGENDEIGVVELRGTYDDNGTSKPWGLVVESRDGSINAVASPSEFLDFSC